MNPFRRATENNSLIPAIVSALAFYPEVMAFPVKGEGARGKRLVVPKGTADILGVKQEMFALRGQGAGGSLIPGMRPVLSDVATKGCALALSIGRAFAIETKWTHTATCKCDSCAAQRLWRVEWEKRGGLYILARTPQEAIDGLMGRRAA